MIKILKILPILFISLISNLFGETIENIEDITPDSLFAKYVGTHVIYDLYDCAVMIDEKLGIERDEYDMALEEIGIFAPIKFEVGKEYPSEGFWFHRFHLTQEGKTKTYNICCIAQDNNPPQIIPMIMGNTLASPILQQDTLMQVAISSALKETSKYSKEEFYDSFIIADSNVIQPPDMITKKDETLKDVRYEEWIVRACEKEFPLIIQFIPDGQGGTYFTIFDPSNL